MDNTVSRRNFLQGAGLAAVAGAATLGLGACSPAASGKGDGSGAAGAQNGAGRHTWEVVPDPIGKDKIVEEFTADVVVVGAGIAGCCAALTAIESGASVICLQKHSDILTNGAGAACYNSRGAREAGIEIDTDDLFETWRIWAENRVDRNMYQLWVDHSGETCDWLEDTLEGSGIVLGYNPAPTPDQVKAMPFVEKTYATSFMIAGAGMIDAMKVVGKKAADKGVDFYFSTPAVQLVRGEDGKSGRVTAVIGQNADDKKYYKFNAEKAVILCAGDYANNMEMREVWAPHLADLESPYAPPVNTGDGDLMGMWVGAQMDRGPHCSNIHYDIGMDNTSTAFCGSGGAPWLRVNKNGERFSNEDTAYQQIYAQDLNQPEHMHFQVFDSKFPAEWGQLGGGEMRGDGFWPGASSMLWADVLKKNGGDPSQYDNDYDIVVEGGVSNGVIYKADTLEELAKQMDVPADVFAATVNRYTELAQKGVDEDFGKASKFLFTIDQAPFYAIPRKAHPLGILNGLTVNTSLQVLDTENKPIEGLYAAGNNSGGNFFGGMVQPMCTPALTCGRAMFTGRLAAKNAIKNV